MKKVILLFLILLLVSGCGLISYKVCGKTLSFDESVDFRHLHFQISDVFDYGSETNYRFYDLYDKKPNMIYRVGISQKSGKMDDAIKSLKELYDIDKTSTQKYHNHTWTMVSYKVEDVVHHTYFASYNDKEFYQIDFVNAKEGSSFEKAFMKKVRIDVEK